MTQRRGSDLMLNRLHRNAGRRDGLHRDVATDKGVLAVLGYKPQNLLGSENWAITGIVTGYATRRFEADKDGATIDLKMSYDQPVGIVNVAKQTVFLELIRSNPKGFPVVYADVDPQLGAEEIR